MNGALDLRGLTCPAPVLKAKRALAQAAPGEAVALLTDDPGAVADLAAFARQSGHGVVSQAPEPGAPGVTRHVLRRRLHP
ncbi:MAG: sulfurtransferase TusA family protein [Duodenibacillus sp.]|nr:sulfurtransferase TusA family protein [Duodenibacillus sp.]